MLIQVNYNLLKRRQAPASPTPGLGKCALAPRCCNLLQEQGGKEGKENKNIKVYKIPGEDR